MLIQHASGGVNVYVCSASILSVTVCDMLRWGFVLLSWKDMVITATRNLNSTQSLNCLQVGIQV